MLNTSNGAISGTLTATGVFNFRITATLTSSSCTNFGDYAIVVTCPTITLTPPTLPGGTIGASYSQSVTASPLGTYTYAVTSGSLPNGLMLNTSNGTISGTPTTANTFNFRITATLTGSSCTGFSDYAIVVTCPAITLASPPLPGGTVGTSYSQSVSASPAGTYTYAVTSGSLPNGLMLNTSNGTISGTPTVANTFNFRITATLTSSSCTNFGDYAIVVTCPTITLTPPPLPGGTVGASYSQSVAASPAGTYTYAVTSGSLPNGLMLNTSNGTISGTLTATGIFNFRITATLTGSSCTGFSDYAIVVTCPNITLASPPLPGGTVGTSYSQSVSASPAGTYTYAVTSGSLPNGLMLNTSNGTISGTPTVANTFNFRITATLTGSSCTGFSDYSITVAVIACTSITCPTDIFVGTTGNSATVNYSPPVANGNCGTITCSPASGSSFAVGVTTVSCASSIGNQTCAFRVTVNKVGGTATDPLLCTGPSNNVSATLVMTNTGNIDQTVSATTTFTNLVGVPGSCIVSPNIGTCEVTNGGLTYNGTLSPGQTVTMTYLTQVSDLAPPAAQVCTNNSVSFNAGAAFAFSVCDVVDCPAPGPGGIFPARSESGDQAAGSVLIYNVYTSGSTNGNTQNTRVNATNTHPLLPAFVHLFFVAEGCSVADSYICLTANQTASFLASDLDPGTTGYIVAVATDRLGCPINFNYLIGDEYVKFQSGHAANLGAQGFSAIAGGRPACDGNSVTAQVNFDGVSYDRTPRTLALSNIGSRADGNETLLVLNRIAGNLGTGASTLSTIFGIFYDDAENALSFSLSGDCQLRNSINNNFPRTTPRFETFIPAGRTGWMRFFSQSDFGMTGAAINFNANASASAGAFNQGHNLHALTLSSAASYVIPVFPPGC